MLASMDGCLWHVCCRAWQLARRGRSTLACVAHSYCTPKPSLYGFDCTYAVTVQALDAIDYSSKRHTQLALQLAAAVVRFGATGQRFDVEWAAYAVADVVAVTAELLLRTQLPAAEAALAAWLTAPPPRLHFTGPRHAPACPPVHDTGAP
jgi:hypothetical protein